MNFKRCNNLRYITAVAVGTLIAFYCPTRLLVIILALMIILLGLSIPKY